jgi:hypothetical protein
MREKAYAAQAPMKTEPSEPTSAMIIEFLYHEVYGRDASSKRVRKLASDEGRGSANWSARTPPG